MEYCLNTFQSHDSQFVLILHWLKKCLPVGTIVIFHDNFINLHFTYSWKIDIFMKNLHIIKWKIYFICLYTEPHLPSRVEATTTEAAPKSAPVSSSGVQDPGSQAADTLVAPRPSSPIRLPILPLPDKQDEKSAKFWSVLSAPNMEMGELMNIFRWQKYLICNISISQLFHNSVWNY